MRKEKTMLMFSVLAILLLSMGTVYAAEPGEADISGVVQEGEYLMTSTDTVTIEAGNVTRADVETNMSTYRWAGLYGNVSGQIVLGDDDENTLYSWTAKGNLVYASSASSIAWSSLADANETTVTGIATWLSGTNYADNYTTTFTGASQSIGSSIFSISSDYAQTTGGSGWNTYSLWDTTSLVWAGKVVDGGQAAYRSAAGPVQFQMILPEDGTSGNTVTQAYNLWVELI